MSIFRTIRNQLTQPGRVTRAAMLDHADNRRRRALRMADDGVIVQLLAQPKPLTHCPHCGEQLSPVQLKTRRLSALESDTTATPPGHRHDNDIARAEAAEAECERLRQQVDGLQAEIERLTDGLERAADGEWDAEPCWYARHLLDND